ncbi:MAG TPA: hypothetical protein PK177_08015 [Burkholderiaceae bacterium]|nr:hypothetical protein [Burkholderiaceae bacterium]
MSYRIEYAWKAFVEELPVKVKPRRYVVCTLGGDNNTLHGNDSQPTRCWEVGMLGDESAVIKRAVFIGRTCESGELKPYGRAMSPEGYIRIIRRALAAAVPVSDDAYWYPAVSVSPDSPLVGMAMRMALTVTPYREYGQDRVRVEFDGASRLTVFDFASAFPELQAWCLAKASIRNAH